MTTHSTMRILTTTSRLASVSTTDKLLENPTTLLLTTPISTYRRLLIFIEFKILIVLTEILKTK